MSDLMYRPLGRQPVLDGLRGVAIILVLLRHLAPSTFGGGGFVGVQLFFVLSGFLITSLLIDERMATGRVSFRAFYARRALRLLPALYTLLAIYSIAALVLTGTGDLSKWLPWVAAAAVYLTPFAGLLGIPEAPGLNPLWTLAVEEIFYVFWPIALLLLLRAASRNVALWVTGGAVVAFAAVRWITYLGFGSDIYETPTTWIDALLIGCLLAQLWTYKLLPHLRGLWVLPFAAVILIAVTLWSGAKEHAFTYGPLLTVLAAVGAVSIWSATDQSAGLARLLRTRVLRWFGTRSYGLYLWNGVFLLQEPVRGNFLTLGGALIASLVLAELSYRFVERPALRLKRRFERDRTQPQRQR
ncbi:acyltransferase family protein [Cnuibacter sp. UC19_7]|uniref:acyltransferase family protein n=1 Tax=Cnuibacter sp. UC19_7 TaxID=3350166 RepID=UPI00366F27A6